MASPRPTLYLNFVNTPNLLDPRMVFTRNSIASYDNQAGQVAYVAANTPRWTFDTSSGECLGLIIEPKRINAALYSEDFTNAAWTKTNCSVTSNAVAAPDGATTADLLVAQAAGGLASQAVTVTSGMALSFSCFAKAGATNFVRLRASDGVNSFDTWFNLSTGAAATNTSGAGGCVFLAKQIQAYPSGWYRCGMLAASPTTTAFTFSIAPTSADNTTSATSDSAYVWGAQVETGSTSIHGITSYIPTTASTVVREPDNMYTNVSVAVDKWFSQANGSVYFEWTNLAASNSSGILPGGIGDSFSNTVYVTKGSAIFGATFIRNASGNSRTIATTISPGERLKVVAAWNSTNIAFCYNGNSTTWASSGTSYVPASTQRIGIGMAPWATTSEGTLLCGIFRVAAYYPFRLPNEEMVSLTTL